MEGEITKNILWKYDSELGWAYFCPSCKRFLCMNEKKCGYCGQKINWKNKIKYKGKVIWN
jgi:rRNA maturation endonuclease Nob1